MSCLAMCGSGGRQIGNLYWSDAVRSRRASDDYRSHHRSSIVRPPNCRDVGCVPDQICRLRQGYSIRYRIQRNRLALSVTSEAPLCHSACLLAMFLWQNLSVPMRWRRRMNHQAATGMWNAMAVGMLLFNLCAPSLVRGQTNNVATPNRSLSAGCPSCCTMSVAERTREEGCYVLANDALESLPQGPLYWHLYTYPNLAAASQAD